MKKNRSDAYVEINILVALDANYLRPLRVLLQSLFMNSVGVRFRIYLMHSSITEEQLDSLARFVEKQEHEFFVILVKDDYFKDAPVVGHYTKEMYYRLLAYQFLPSDLDKALYLDPDILVINDISTLYEQDISDYLFAAAYHERPSIREINRLRLKGYDIEAYYNSGVLLMNLALQRKKIDPQDIFNFVEKNKKRLILPDQDIINALYSKEIKNVDEVLFNYDPRYYRYYKLVSNGKYDMDYVINHTVVLHFCGKKKPWHKNYSGKFHSLYKHYEKIAFS